MTPAFNQIGESVKKGDLTAVVLDLIPVLRDGKTIDYFLVEIKEGDIIRTKWWRVLECTW